MFGLPSTATQESIHKEICMTRLRFARDVVFGQMSREVRSAINAVGGGPISGVSGTSGGVFMMHCVPQSSTAVSSMREVHHKCEQLRTFPYSGDVARIVTNDTIKFPRSTYIRIIGAGTIVPTVGGQWNWHLARENGVLDAVHSVMDTDHKMRCS